MPSHSVLEKLQHSRPMVQQTSEEQCFGAGRTYPDAEAEHPEQGAW